MAQGKWSEFHPVGNYLLEKLLHPDFEPLSEESFVDRPNSA